MKILSVTAQKPNSTGSGIYLTELVKAMDEEGHEQAVVAGINREDAIELPDRVGFYPVYFEQEDLPYPIVGMSDEMPYVSTRYCDLTPEMTEQFKNAFVNVLKKAVEELNPDVILCHHLYLLTAIVREHFPGRRVYGFCHNTDLRQMQKNSLETEYIRTQICALDRVYALQQAQKVKILEIYGLDPAKVQVVGTGYNSEVFWTDGPKKSSLDGKIRIAYAGKIAEKKGVMSLMRALRQLPYREEELEVLLAGGAGNQKEYQEIVELSKLCACKVKFLGKLTQPELAKVYNACDIFVLPSFFEGLPLTVIEALACGDRVVMTELPGIREWMKETVPGADIRYVRLPEMRNADEPVLEELPAFEQRLKDVLEECIEAGETNSADVSNISWETIACEVVREGI